LLAGNLGITTLAGAVEWERLEVWPVGDIADAAQQVFESQPPLTRPAGADEN
jgi:hypothetical protein